MKEDILEVKDSGEAVSMMEPLLIAVGSKHRGVFNDIALDLATFAARFRERTKRYITKFTMFHDQAGSRRSQRIQSTAGQR